VQEHQEEIEEKESLIEIQEKERMLLIQ